MRFGFIAVIALASFTASTARGVTFADGLLHIIDSTNSFPSEPILIGDGPGGIPTTVNVVDGGVASDIRIEGSGAPSPGRNSIVNVLGGSVTGTLSSCPLLTTCTAQVTISGGEVANVGDSLDNWGSILMSGGSVTNTLWVAKQITEITGGTVAHLVMNAGADAARTLTISGGVFGDVSGGGGTPLVNITGGDFLGLVNIAGVGDPWTIDGGVFHDLVWVQQTPSLTITGGVFLGDEIEVTFVARRVEISGGEIHSLLDLQSDGGTTRIHGSNFNYPLGMVSDTSGVLTGILADGTPINTSFVRFGPEGLLGHTLILVPEPSTGLLFGIGVVGVAVIRRRMRVV